MIKQYIFFFFLASLNFLEITFRHFLNLIINTEMNAPNYLLTYLGTEILVSQIPCKGKKEKYLTSTESGFQKSILILKQISNYSTIRKFTVKAKGFGNTFFNFFLQSI